MLCSHSCCTYNIQHCYQIMEKMSYSFDLRTHKYFFFCSIHDYFLHILYNILLYDQSDCDKNNKQGKSFGTDLCEAIFVGKIFWIYVLVVLGRNVSFYVEHHFLSSCCLFHWWSFLLHHHSFYSFLHLLSPVAMYLLNILLWPSESYHNQDHF